MDIAHNIKKRRLELGLSQQALAEAIGYQSRSAIAKIESGANDIPLSKLVVLARTLDTSIEALLGAGRAETSAPSAEERRRTQGGRRNVAVVMAGGRSSRNLQNVPNQFISVSGKPVIAYCLEVYQQHPLIDDIYIVCVDEWKSILSGYVKEYGLEKVRGLISAGRTGIESVRNAVTLLGEAGYSDHDIVVFQEATRPFVTEDLVSRLLMSCRKNGSAITCESMTESVQFYVDKGRTRYVDRDKLVALQSPDAHTLETMRGLFEKARRKDHKLTESCVGLLMSNLGMNLKLCEGPHNNLKIVRQEDVAVFSALLKVSKV